MRLSDQILRGLRWGAIVLAALTICLLGYRLAREPSAAADPARTSTRPPMKNGEAPAHPAANDPTGAPAAPQPAPRPSPARSREVPPPPPLGMKFTHNRGASGASGRKTENGETVLKENDESTAAGDNADDSAAEGAGDQDADKAAEEKSDPEETGAAAAREENASDHASNGAANNRSRGKRMLKAVGRFLHLTPHPYAPSNEAARTKN